MQNNIEILHHQAMELVDSFACAQGDRALLAKQQGDVAGGMDLLRSAFEQERSAANLVADQLDFEPTRSVLRRWRWSVWSCGRRSG